MDDAVCLDVSQELAALRAVFDSLAEHVVVLDAQGIIVDANTAWRRFVEDSGRDAASLLGSAYVLACPTIQAGSSEGIVLAQGLEKVLSGILTGFHMEYSCTISSKKHWFLVYVRPWFVEDELAGAVISHTMITQHKEVEYALQRYERAIASSPSLVSIVDRDFRYVLVNDTYLRYHARRREDIEGRSVAEVMGEKAFARVVRPQLERCFAGETFQYEAWFSMAGMGRRCMQVTYYPCQEMDGSISGAVVSAQDVTERRVLEDQVRRTATLLAETQALAHVGSLERDVDSGSESWSDELFRILGYQPGEVHADMERFIEHIHPEDRTQFVRTLTEAQAVGNPFHLDVRLRTQQGEDRWASVACAFDKGDGGAVVRIHFAVADITERRLAELRLEELASTDQLTGLSNRRQFFAWLEDEARRAERFGRPLCVAMVDVDHFKKVNDTYGHGVGDRVLAAVAQTLRDSVRAVDRVARVGGEEFAILFPETRVEAAAAILERIREAVAAEKMTAGEGSFSVTVSCGVAQRQSGESGEELLSRADDALYAAKAAGRNQVQVARGADEQ